jgi:hypothetical protein
VRFLDFCNRQSLASRNRLGLTFPCSANVAGVHMRMTILAMLIGTGLFTTTSSARAAAYTFNSVDVPGASRTRPAGVNAPEQIVGSFFVGTTTHGFLDIGGSFTKHRRIRSNCDVSKWH